MWKQYVTCKDTEERLTPYKGLIFEQSLTTDVTMLFQDVFLSLVIFYPK